MGTARGRVARDPVVEDALAGSHEAFAQLVERHRSAIHLHCYRMLGSFHDAEEATQEALLRAWSALASYDARAPFGHWLYRIATNTCLMMIRASGRRPRVVAEVSHLEPYPDGLLDTLGAASIDPARAVEHRDSVTLAFIAALQLLPATQRAVVILKDVLAFSSAEIAATLGSTVAAVNSSLQRARAQLRRAPAFDSRDRLDHADQQVLARFVSAWEHRDVDGLAALLAEDAILRMPPEPLRLEGPRDIIDFLTTVPAQGRLDLIPLVPTRANGRPALAAYGPVPGDPVPVAYGIMVLDIADSLVTGITGFQDPSLFDGFRLPATYPDHRQPGPFVDELAGDVGSDHLVEPALSPGS